MATTNEIDEIGAMKLLTPDRIRSAAALVKQGKIYSLGQVLEPSMPHLPRHPPLVVAPFTTPYQSQRRWEKRGAKNLPGTASERVEVNTHSGTHIDALGHWSNCNRSYGELDAKENYTENGLAHLGLERIPPIVTRGILIDVAGQQGKAMLAAGAVVTVRDIQSFLEDHRLSIAQGDVVLLHTGWSKLWKQRGLRYCETEPGPGRDTATWLADQRIVALGTDTMAVTSTRLKIRRTRASCIRSCSWNAVYTSSKICIWTRWCAKKFMNFSLYSPRPSSRAAAPFPWNRSPSFSEVP